MVNSVIFAFALISNSPAWATDNPNCELQLFQPVLVAEHGSSTKKIKKSKSTKIQPRYLYASEESRGSLDDLRAEIDDLGVRLREAQDKLDSRLSLIAELGEKMTGRPHDIEQLTQEFALGLQALSRLRAMLINDPMHVRSAVEFFRQDTQAFELKSERLSSLRVEASPTENTRVVSGWDGHSALNQENSWSDLFSGSGLPVGLPPK